MALPSTLFNHYLARQWAETERKRQNDQSAMAMATSAAEQGYKQRQAEALGQQSRQDKLDADQWRKQAEQERMGLQRDRMGQQQGQFEAKLGQGIDEFGQTMQLKGDTRALEHDEFLTNQDRLREQEEGRQEIAGRRAGATETRARTGAGRGRDWQRQQQFNEIKMAVENARRKYEAVTKQRRSHPAEKAQANSDLVQMETAYQLFLEQNPRFKGEIMEAMRGPAPTADPGQRRGAAVGESVSSEDLDFGLKEHYPTKP